MRKTKTVTINDEKSRDNGKSYLLTEMPVDKAEKWAARALLAILKSGGEVAPGAEGMAGLAGIGITALARIAWEDAEPLLDEMMGCVKACPSPTITRPLLDGADDIEEVKTMLSLRKEIFSLHFDFFDLAVDSTSDTKVPPASS